MKLAYFDITGETILALLKNRTNLPEDVSLVYLHEPITFHNGAGIPQPHNLVRIVIKSESFDDKAEGNVIPLFNVTVAAPEMDTK